ncbi:MAG TPA: TerB family tellurite resistance protein [Mycobacteriales bacterium]|nr:TerB family tellurite resistance protein [Mycobacteriales bacterium]
MPEATLVTSENDVAEREAVEHERAELREFVQGLSFDDIKSGGWFSQLLSRALSSYTDKVTWQYFQEKYEGVPVDAIADQRIKMAARYAAVEGGLSASAYTAAISATIGSGGGASPLTVPAGATTVLVDIAFVTQLQIRLAYDIAVLYRVPIDTSDPDDLWKLIRVAFTIKSGEAAREGVVKVVPVVVRPLIKRFYSGNVLNAAKALPVVGKSLLQRNVIKIGIPLVGVPLAVAVNRYSTMVAGRHAQAVFRNEARVIELAESLAQRSRHPQLMLWVAWLVIQADGKISDEEALLMRQLVRVVRDRHQVVDEQLADVVDIDPADVWRRVDAEADELGDIIDMAERVAGVDGALNAGEKRVIAELQDRCVRV